MGTVVFSLISGILSGIVAIAATMAIEKLGGIFGGTLSTLPTTIIPASIGIALSTQDGSNEFQPAMHFVPVGLLIDAVFLLTWRILPRRLDPDNETGFDEPSRCTIYSRRKRLYALVAITLTIWVLCSLLVLYLDGVAKKHVATSTVGLTALMITFWLGAWSACVRPVPSPKGTQVVGYGTLALRGAFVTCTIFVAVMFSTRSGRIAGLLTTFPSIFITTMVAMYLSQGDDVLVGAVGPMMLGSVSVQIYAMTYSYTRYHQGLIGGMFLSLSCSVVYSACVAWVQNRIQERIRRDQEQYSQVDEQIAIDMTLNSDEDSEVDSGDFDDLHHAPRLHNDSTATGTGLSMTTTTTTQGEGKGLTNSKTTRTRTRDRPGSTGEKGARKAPRPSTRVSRQRARQRVADGRGTVMDDSSSDTSSFSDYGIDIKVKHDGESSSSSSSSSQPLMA